jgi:hypothetical protein
MFVLTRWIFSFWQNTFDGERYNGVDTSRSPNNHDDSLLQYEDAEEYEATEDSTVEEEEEEEDQTMTEPVAVTRKNSLRQRSDKPRMDSVAKRIPVKKLSSFELQMEGIASKDNEKIELVNPSVKVKPSQGPEGYEEAEDEPKYDIDSMPEAPRVPSWMKDSTSRPRAVRGHSFDGTDRKFGDEGPRGGKKKPVEKLLNEKQEEQHETFSKPIVHADESERPEYAHRPGVLRGKSGIGADELPKGLASTVAEASRGGRKKKSPAIADNGDTNGHKNGRKNGLNGSGHAKDNLPEFLKDRPAPPAASNSNEPLPGQAGREISAFGVTLRGTRKGAKLFAGEEIAHRVGGIKLLDDDN